MTQPQIKALETELWDAADNLRANSTLQASEYKDPLLGLVLLRGYQTMNEKLLRDLVRVFRKLSIIIPTKNEMRDYHTLAGRVFSEVTNVQKQNTLLREARDLLLPRLMAGVVEV